MLGYEDVNPIETGKVKFMAGLGSSTDGRVFEYLEHLIKVVCVNQLTLGILAFASLRLCARFAHDFPVNILAKKIGPLALIWISQLRRGGPLDSLGHDAALSEQVAAWFFILAAAL